jgi:hypothetical protein
MTHADLTITNTAFCPIIGLIGRWSSLAIRLSAASARYVPLKRNAREVDHGTVTRMMRRFCCGTSTSHPRIPCAGSISAGAGRFCARYVPHWDGRMEAKWAQDQDQMEGG